MITNKFPHSVPTNLFLAIGWAILSVLWVYPRRKPFEAAVCAINATHHLYQAFK